MLRPGRGGFLLNGPSPCPSPRASLRGEGNELLKPDNHFYKATQRSALRENLRQLRRCWDSAAKNGSLVAPAYQLRVIQRAANIQMLQCIVLQTRGITPVDDIKVRGTLRKKTGADSFESAPARIQLLRVFICDDGRTAARQSPIREAPCWPAQAQFPCSLFRNCWPYRPARWRRCCIAGTGSN